MGEIHLQSALPGELGIGNIDGLRATDDCTIDIDVEWEVRELVKATI